MRHNPAATRAPVGVFTPCPPATPPPALHTKPAPPRVKTMGPGASTSAPNSAVASPRIKADFTCISTPESYICGVPVWHARTHAHPPPPPPTPPPPGAAAAICGLPVYNGCPTTPTPTAAAAAPPVAAPPAPKEDESAQHMEGGH